MSLNDEQIEDLRGRIRNATRQLTEMREDTTDEVEQARLDGKRQGLEVALDYLRGY